MDTQTAEARAQTFFDRVWAEPDDAAARAAIEELLCPDCQSHGLGADRAGPEAFKAFHALVRRHYAVSMVVHEVFVKGERWAVRADATLRHRRSGRSATLAGASFWTLREDRISQARDTWNFLSLVEQLELPLAEVAATFGGGGPVPA